MGLARRVAVVLLVLAGLLGISQPASAADGNFVNLSNRGLVGEGDDVRIVGFIIEGGARQVLIQAKGPELANDGISNALADPVLTVIQTHEGEPPRTPLVPPVELMVNDNWEDSQGQLVSDLWGGSPPLTAGSLSAAVVLTLEPGGYTAKVEGKNETVGVAIVEVYRIASDDGDQETTHGVGATLSDLPTGSWTPDVTTGGLFSSSGGNVTVRLNDGGYIEEGSFRYTCQNSGGCAIENRSVTSGTIVQTAQGTAPGGGTGTDTQPSFGPGSGPGNQSFTVDTAISALTLPEASGGDGSLTYSLTPSVPGLSFNPTTRRLTGMPTTASTYNMTYQVRDADGDTDSLTFTIAVQEEVSSAPDLVVQSPSVSASTLTEGESFTFRATVHNQGSGRSAATTLRYYRSTDATITTGDTEIGTGAVSSLAAAASSEQSISLTVPSGTGIYYYGACVEAVSGESSTVNNCSRPVSVTVGASQMEIESFDLADISPAGITFANNRFFVVHTHFRNAGLPPRVRVYLASGQREPADDFDLPEDNDWPLAITFANNKFFVPDWRDNKVYAYQSSGQREPASDFDLDAAQRYAVEGIVFANDRFFVVDENSQVYAYHSSGQRDSVSDFDLDSANSSPKGITFANDRFYVVDDSDDRIYAYQTSGQRDSTSEFDLDEDNGYPEGITFANDALYVVYGSFGKKVVAVKLTDQFPDLLVESPSVSDSDSGSAVAFVLSATVRNLGTKASAATTLRYYRSDDRTISTSDMQVGTDEVGALPVGGASAETITLIAPSTEGAYYYGACVDSATEEAETENNCSNVVVVFGGGPFPAYDLDISATLHRPSVATIGISSIAMTVEVANEGPNASRPAKLRFLTASGREFDREIPVLEPNETRTYERVGVGVAQLGTSTVQVCITEAPGETNTNNNCASRSYTYILDSADVTQREIGVFQQDDSAENR